MKELLLLCDYKGHFGSKFSAIPYRSGMDKKKLLYFFGKAGFSVAYKRFPEIDFREEYRNKIVLYTSVEEKHSGYKDYIEDVVLGLELAGAIVIPGYKYLRATDNKVMMEILRDLTGIDQLLNIKSEHAGSFEDFQFQHKAGAEDRFVFKTASGAQGRGVGLAKGKELFQSIKYIAKTKPLRHTLIDNLRKIKHKGYTPETQYGRKFVVQNLIENLHFDYKVLVYGKKLYILKRENRANDFRASGSGNFKFEKHVPEEVMEFAMLIKEQFRVPNISLDIGFKNKTPFLIEFQCLYFGTTTIEKSAFYFKKDNNSWITIDEKPELEREYAASITDFLNEDQKR